MTKAYDKKSGKSLKHPQRYASLGIPTNIAVGPLGFRAELDIDPKDENNPRPSRIVFRDKTSEDQSLHPPQTSTTSGMIDRGTEYRNDPTKEHTDDTIEEGEPTEAIRILERDTAPGAAPALVYVAEGAVDGFGPLRALLAAISAIYLEYGGTVVVRNKIEDLLSRIAALEARFATRPGNVEEQRHRHELIHKFKGIEGHLRMLYEKSGLQLATDHVQDDENVLGLLEDLRETISDYQMVQRVAIYERECRLIDPSEAAVLNQFRSAKEAEYRHGERKGCLKGTRGAILDDVEHWSRDFDKPPIYWLNGLAGTGKTTIAQTVAERLFAEGQLGASFFCSRDFEDRSNLHFIFPTLAIQLARRYTEFRSIFVPLAQSDPGIAYESLYNQMNKLIVQPLRESAISTVIVIDALDECKDDEPVSVVLSVLGRFVSRIPGVKILVTGRPEPRIRDGFRLPLLAQVTDVFVLHEVESGRVNSDIRLFFKHRFSEIAGRRGGLDGWPTEEQLDLLCERAAGLFVYAVATVRSIDHKNSSPKKQLDRLLQSPESSAFEGKTRFTANMTLDLLYASILQEAFGDGYPEDDPKVRSVLGAVVLAVNPLSPSTIATLLGFDVDEVFPLLSSVHSLLTLREDVDQPIQPFHKSFPDFVIDPARCANLRFRVSPPDQHAELLVGCLELMNRGLEQNMCKLPDGIMNFEVDDLRERADQCIDQALQYACRSWHKHLVDTTPAHALNITSALHQFLEGKLLFWLEVLSVLGAAREAVDALEAAVRWLDAPPTLNLVNDYFRFVIASFEVISTSAPHIYHSALPLSPRTSIVRKLYKSYVRPLTRVVRGLPISWESITANVRHLEPANEAAWSPCSRFIAVALFRTIEILDAVTLERLYTFTRPWTGETDWLSFSPDSRSLTWFGHDDYELITWDLQTGGWISAIPSTPNTPSSRYFSSAYSMDGNMVAVAYRDSDNTAITVISTYNLLSGTHIYSHRVLEGRVVASIWTHDGFLRFVTVKQGSITTWEVGFTSIHTLAEVGSSPAPDDIGSEEPLFLPTRSRLAFILREAVLVWDVQDSRLLLNFVGDKQPKGPSFSSDGRFFACGTIGQEIHLWKESPVGYILHKKLVTGIDKEMGWLSIIRADTTPLLSPNGESIITSKYSETQLWRTADLITPLPGVLTHPTERTDVILEFSPDKSFAGTARLRDNMVTILDLKSGDPCLIIDTGVKICGLGVTRNAIFVVGEGKIITWDLPAGDRVLDARANIYDSVRTVVFNHPAPPPTWLQSASISPDFSYFVITRGEGEGLDVYDISTGKHLARTTIKCGRIPWFTQDGREVWASRIVPVDGWKIIKETESNGIRLQRLPTNKRPGVYPWESSHGHDITDDGWIINSKGERLMWLPHYWRKFERYRMWDGQFMGLLDDGLPEPVILELGE